MKKMMAIPSKKNSPVEGEKKKKLVFSLELIVQTLSKESRKVLAEEFAGELESLGYAKQYVSMLLNGKRILGNDALKRLLANSSAARTRAIELLKEQIKELEEAIEILQNSDSFELRNLYPPKTIEDDEE